MSALLAEAFVQLPAAPPEMPPAFASSSDSNMAAILSALLMAAAAVGIISFFTWMCGCCPVRERDRRRRERQQQLLPITSKLTFGMSSEAIERIPCMTYACLLERLSQHPPSPSELGQAERSPTIRYDDEHEGEAEAEEDHQAAPCSVCLLPFDAQQPIRVLPSCCHFFHAACIDVWLRSNASCPLCRENLRHPFAKLALLAPERSTAAATV